MEFTKKSRATIALLVSVVGSVATLPTASGAGFWQNLLNHGFLASTIGGLADWFAVTALFRKPLWGLVSYRTEILKRNRRRITDSIVAFAADDLLSTDNIMSVVDGEDTAKLLTDYLQNRGGRERVKDVVIEVALGVASVIDTKGIGAALAPALRQGIDRLPLKGMVRNALLLPGREHYARVLLQILLKKLRQLYFDENIQHTVAEHIVVLRRDYEADGMGRAFVLASLGLTDERMLTLLNERVDSILTELIDGQGGIYPRLLASFMELAKKIADDEQASASAVGFLRREVGKTDLAANLSQWLHDVLRDPNPFWLDDLSRFVDGEIDDFAAHREKQEAFDRATKDFIKNELQKHHDVMPQMIRERFDKWSDDTLTEFVESRIADDLQMIRINGAVVGGIVGMALYALVWALERLCQ